MKKTFSFILLTAVLLTLAACAPGEDVQINTPDATIRLSTPGPNPLSNEAAEDGAVAGVGQGLWHGLIAPVTLVMSFFNPAVQMYEVHNIGNEYNLGFLTGVAVVFLFLGVLGRR
ncbi:MAG: hypothetical protein AB1649_16195 [Chloroflexota bacterium]